MYKKRLEDIRNEILARKKRTYSDRLTIETFMLVNPFEGDWFYAYEIKLVVEIYDILLKAFEILSFLFMR